MESTVPSVPSHWDHPWLSPSLGLAGECFPLRLLCVISERKRGEARQMRRPERCESTIATKVRTQAPELLRRHTQGSRKYAVLCLCRANSRGALALRCEFLPSAEAGRLHRLP